MWGTCHAAARHTLALGTEVTVQSRRPAQSPLGPGSRVAASGSRRPPPGDAGASAPSRSAVPGPVPALRPPSPPPCAVAHGEQRAASVTQRAREGVRKRDVWVWGHQRHVCEASRGGDWHRQCVCSSCLGVRHTRTVPPQSPEPEQARTETRERPGNRPSGPIPSLSTDDTAWSLRPALCWRFAGRQPHAETGPSVVRGASP